MDLTSTIIMLATCVFFLFGLVTLTSSLPLAFAGSIGLAAAMVTTTRALDSARPSVDVRDS
ncbi:hypothetical protein ATM97_14295 [Nocardia sp. MH4]|nr:hypothetical protein [Nocardia sp. MH4]